MKAPGDKSLAEIGELALIKLLCRRLPLRGDVITAAGDDCAVVRIAGDQDYDYLLKSDGVVAGTHFQLDSKPELIGHKALGRVLSDMAAMGGKPLWALVDLTAPPKTPLKYIEKIYGGMIKLAKQFQVAMVGGDTSAGGDLQLHVFAVGRAKKGKVVLRSGAKAGEAIFVTGALGGSLAGKHLHFTPRLAEGQWLAKGGWATAMIDISDGLLRDLGHIVSASRVGARLMLDKIPVAAVVRRSASAKGALKHALNDGEDYELLFTVPAGKVKRFLEAWRRAFKLACVQIGWVTAYPGRLEGIGAGGKKISLNATGYEHFH